MFEQWVAQFDLWVHQLGPYGFLVLGLAALIEYVWPPFPGDTVVFMGGAYAVRGELAWEAVLLVTTLGAMLGLSFNYGVGRLIAQRIEKFPEGRLWFGFTHQKIREVQERMRTQGAWLLAINRFLPVRSVLFIAAGAARMRYSTVLLWGACSALVWNTLLLGIGMWVGGNVQTLMELFSRYNRVALLVILSAALTWAAIRWWRRRLRSA